MKTESIHHYLKSKGQLVERQLDALVSENGAPYSKLFQAARYSLLSGGKRLRPILTLATCETLNGPLDLALTPACALEMIHTYSMIHDDLPCMDNDDFRRGIPTLHKAFPEGHALLAGDYLLTQAFEVLADAPGLSAECKVALIRRLAQASGGHGMIGGQIMDVEAENSPIDMTRLSLIHQCKTGALIAASVDFGAILANASSEQKVLLHAFAQDIGLAFQIVDDVLDVTSSEQKHGKAIASDVANGKATYVTLLGIERSKEEIAKLYNSALDHLNKLSFDPFLLTELAKLIVQRVY